MAALLPIASVACLYLLGIAFAFADVDAPCWYLANTAVLVGILGLFPFWVKIKHPIPGLGSMYLKAAVVAYVAYGWWTLKDPGANEASSLEYFWAMPPFLLIWNLLEFLLAKRYIVGPNKTPAA